MAKKNIKYVLLIVPPDKKYDAISILGEKRLAFSSPSKPDQKDNSAKNFNGVTVSKLYDLESKIVADSQLGDSIGS